jgi:predicted metal-dependent hydrolase
MEIKNTHFRSSAPISKVLYDTKIRDLNSALGTHTFVSRVQGGKLKAKNEIRISHLFKKIPEPFLRMIVTHELAHLKEKEHNKSFYNLCTHIEPQYHQLEFEVRLYLTHLDLFGELYSSTNSTKTS